MPFWVAITTGKHLNGFDWPTLPGLYVSAVSFFDPSQQLQVGGALYHSGSPFGVLAVAIFALRLAALFFPPLARWLEALFSPLARRRTVSAPAARSGIVTYIIAGLATCGLVFVATIGTSLALPIIDKVMAKTFPPVMAEWNAGEWGACSQNCGGRGVSYRSVQCHSVDGAEVGSRYCTAPSPAGSKYCNNGPCETYNWHAGVWQACSQPCGGGKTTREVVCHGSRIRRWSVMRSAHRDSLRQPRRATEHHVLDRSQIRRRWTSRLLLTALPPSRMVTGCSSDSLS